MSELSQDALVALSVWIDAGNRRRDPEAITWGRLGKLMEESGEVALAFIGATGQNPRKGVTHTMDDVSAELLDVAVTALGAYEHINGHMGDSLRALDRHIIGVAARAGVMRESPMPDGAPGTSSPVCVRCGEPNPRYRPEDDPRKGASGSTVGTRSMDDEGKQG